MEPYINTALPWTGPLPSGWIYLCNCGIWLCEWWKGYSTSTVPLHCVICIIAIAPPCPLHLPLHHSEQDLSHLTFQVTLQPPWLPKFLAKFCHVLRVLDVTCAIINNKQNNYRPAFGKISPAFASLTWLCDQGKDQGVTYTIFVWYTWQGIWLWECIKYCTTQGTVLHMLVCLSTSRFTVVGYGSHYCTCRFHSCFTSKLFHMITLHYSQMEHTQWPYGFYYCSVTHTM